MTDEDNGGDDVNDNLADLPPLRTTEDDPDTEVELTDTEQMLALLDGFSGIIEGAGLYRGRLVEQGFSPGIAEVMAADVHRMMVYQAFRNANCDAEHETPEQQMQDALDQMTEGGDADGDVDE